MAALERIRESPDHGPLESGSSEHVSLARSAGPLARSGSYRCGLPRGLALVSGSRSESGQTTAATCVGASRSTPDRDETRLRGADEALAQRPVERYFSTSRDRATRNPWAAGQSGQGAGDVSRTQSRDDGSYTGVVDALEPRFVGKRALSQEARHRT